MAVTAILLATAKDTSLALFSAKVVVLSCPAIELYPPLQYASPASILLLLPPKIISWVTASTIKPTSL